MVSNWTVIFGFIIMAVMAVMAIGWIIPLVFGLVFVRRRRGLGITLLAVAGLWGFLAGSAVVGVVMLVRQQAKMFGEEQVFNPATHQGPTGTVIVAHKGTSSLTLFSAGATQPGRIRIDGKTSSLTVPVGTYSLWNYEITELDATKHAWRASSILAGATTGGLLVVNAKSSQTLDVGPPLAAQVVIGASSKSKADFTLALRDKAGHSWSISGGAPEASKGSGFEVRDKAGKVLWTGKFDPPG